MKTATASTKFTSTRWKVAGRCCDPGSDLTEAFHKKNCRSTSASSSSFTTPEDAEKHSSQNLPGTPNEPRSKAGCSISRRALAPVCVFQVPRRAKLCGLGKLKLLQ